MQKNMQREAKGYLVRNRWHRVWRKIVSILACIVVFCTTYALILPGITLEKKTSCGKEEHVHDEKCYTQKTTKPERMLACNGSTLGLHVHTESCYSAEGQLSCGYADFVIHEHDALCYDGQGALVCELPEIGKHIHSDACYELAMDSANGVELPVPAAADDAVMAGTSGAGDGAPGERETELAEELIVEGEDAQAVAPQVPAAGQQAQQPGITVDSVVVEETGAPRLICTETEIIPHEHQADCYDESGRLVCGMAEVRVHQHTDACFQTVEVPADTETLTCGREESADHRHSARCYGTWELTCGQEEHAHTEECMSTPEEDADTEGHTAVQKKDTDTEEYTSTPTVVEHKEVSMYIGEDSWITGEDGRDHSWDMLSNDVLAIAGKNDALIEVSGKSAGDVYLTHTYTTADGALMMETFHVTVLEAAEESEAAEADTKSDIEQKNEAAEAEAKSDVEQKNEVAEETEKTTETLTETETEAEGETERMTETLTETETEAESETERTTETLTETETEAESETERTTEALTETEVETELETEIETEQTTEALTEMETQTEPGTEQTTEASEQDTEAVIETETETEIETETETEQAAAEAETETESETETEQAIETDPETETETEQITEASSELGTEKEQVSEEETETELATETVTVAQTGGSTGTDTEDVVTEPEYLCGMQEHVHTTECWSEALELACGLEEHTHTEDCLNMDEASDYVLSDMLSEEDEFAGWANLARMPMMAAVGLRNVEGLPLPVTTATGSGTTYDPATGSYSTELKINFSFNKSEVQSNSNYVFTYSKDVLVPDSLIGVEKDLYDYGEKKAGTYTFVKNDDGTYSVQVCFDDAYIQEADQTITGYVSFRGTLNVKSSEDGGIRTQVGKDNLELVIPPEEIKYPGDETDRYDIEVKKSGSYVTEEDKLVYTVYVQSRKGTPNPINFQDAIAASGVNLGTPTVTVQQGPFEYTDQWNINYPGNWDSSKWTTVNVTPNCQDNNITMSLPGLAAGEKVNNVIYGTCYKVTYTYDVSSLDGVNISPKNDVTVQAKDEKTNQTVTDEESVTVNIDKSYSVSKGGQYDAATGQIKWTITINKNKRNIAGALLTDEMLGQLSNGTSVMVSPDSGYTLEKDANDKITGIRFSGINGTANTNEYTITYCTDAEGGWNGEQVTNKATFDPTPNGTEGDEIIGETTVSTSSGSIAKDCGGMVVSADKKTGEITWTVTLNVPGSGLPAGTVIKDQMATGWNGTSTDQWMTRKQITDWATNLYWGDNAGGTNVYNPPQTDITFLASDGNFYSYQKINGNEGNKFEGLKYTVFEIKFPEGLPSPNNQANQLFFTYKTTVDLEKANLGDTKYYNYVEAGGKHDDADYTYHKGGVVKTDGSDRTGITQTSSEGTLIWKVKVTMDKESERLTVTDTLPQGVVLDNVSVSDWVSINPNIDENGNISGENNNYKVSGTYEAATGKVVLTLTGNENNPIQKDANYTFTFTCRADGEQLEEYEPGKTYNFKNSVTVETNNGSLGSSEQTQEWTYTEETVETKVLGKGGTWDNDNRRMSYSIAINPEGKDLVDAADILTLTDVLEYKCKVSVRIQKGDQLVDGKWDYLAAVEASLIQNSVKLYEAVPDGNGNLIRGEEIKNWTWTYDTWTDGAWEAKNTITAEIPDGTPLILEYAYSVSSTARQGVGDIMDLNMKNTAKLEGTSYSDTDDHTQDKWEDADSSGGVTTGRSFTFYKVEEGNYGVNLSGAVFSVYQWDSTAGEYSGIAVKMYTTDKDGMFRIKWKEEEEESSPYQYNTLYKVVETQAPEGYKMPDTVEEYYFYFSNEGDTSHRLPDNIPASAVDLSKTGHTVYVENVRNATDIEVEKVWQDKDGNEVTHNSGNVTVELYQKSSMMQGGGSSSEMVKFRWKGYKDNIHNHWFDEPYDSSKGEKEYELLPIGAEVKLSFAVDENPGNNWVVQQNPSMKINDDKVIEMTREGNSSNFSCIVKIEEDTEVTIICSDWLVRDHGHQSWRIVSLPASGESTQTGSDPLIKAAILCPQNKWHYTFTDLPLYKTLEDGTTVFYSYYIKEITNLPNYTTTYENNGGITNGMIKVINKADDVPGHVLPETGGPGDKLYTVGGLLLIAAAGILLLYNQNKRRKEGSASL